MGLYGDIFLKICKKALENKYYVLSKELFLEKVFKLLSGLQELGFFD